MGLKPKDYSFSYTKSVRDENGNENTVSFQNGYLNCFWTFFKYLLIFDLIKGLFVTDDHLSVMEMKFWEFIVLLQGH